MTMFMLGGKPCYPEEIAAQINAAGFAVLEDYIDANDLKVAQEFANRAVKQNNGNCIIFKGPKEELAGTFMHDLPMNPDFDGLCHAVYEAGTGNKASHAACYQVLRCLSGQLGQKNSMKFHFDSYALAALIPIIIPSEGARGDLLLFPNARRFRRSYAVSLIDKAILASPIRQNSLKRMYACNSDRLVRVRLTPGNLYLFWGYTSAHTNEECDADKIRSTALFHFVDPHATSKLKDIAPTSRLKRMIRWQRA